MTRSSAESHGNFMMVQLRLVGKEDRFGSGATDRPVRDAGRQAREYITAYLASQARVRIKCVYAHPWCWGTLGTQIVIVGA